MPRTKNAALAKSSTPKAQALKAIRLMKDSATFEDIMREIYTLQKLERGLNDAKAGRTTTHASVKQLFSRWLK
ncbi:MAG: hypothetical protein HY22_03955 [[Candidatus Thermochlorobacteriaceae] bacterium GBChlB]|nr:MAG: hypothetical protein HY22_03955 [[Candidatus Thermochlorobacteriaceae] bacterium GBChlB]